MTMCSIIHCLYFIRIRGCGSLIKAFLLTFNPLDLAYKKPVYSQIRYTLTISKKQMKYFTAGLLLLLAASVHSEALPIVKMQTNLGMIVLKLYPEQAPKTVENFLRYAQDGFYDGTLFHRVIKNYMIQGGGYTIGYEKKQPTYPPIPNESDNGLKNQRGTIAMARLPEEPDLATSQFFINVKNNESLNPSSTYSKDGYTVFGEVTEGMEVVYEIQKLKTGTKGAIKKYAPQKPVIIEKITIKTAPTRQKTLESPAAPVTPAADTDMEKDIFADDIDIFADDFAETEENTFSAAETEKDTADAAETEENTFSAAETEKDTADAAETEEKNTFSAAETEKDTAADAAETEENTLSTDAADTNHFSAAETEIQPASQKTIVPSAPVASAETETDTLEAAADTKNATETHQMSKTLTEMSKTLSPPDPASQPDKPEPLPN
jgi:cyclophilin family peptidyl-prolyl cis-trans isomerase